MHLGSRRNPSIYGFGVLGLRKVLFLELLDQHGGNDEVAGSTLCQLYELGVQHTA